MLQSGPLVCCFSWGNWVPGKEGVMGRGPARLGSTHEAPGLLTSQPQLKSVDLRGTAPIGLYFSKISRELFKLQVIHSLCKNTKGSRQAQRRIN